MKILITLSILIIPLFGWTQSKSDIYNPEVPMVFLGADFSKIQFTKEEEFINKPEILRFFDDCNNLLTTRPYQRILKKGLKRDNLKFDYSYVNQNNAAVEWQSVYSDDIEYSLSDEDIERMIQELAVDQEKYKDHIGLVLCEENYSKTKRLGTVAAVFFGVNDLKPIFIKHYAVRPDGFGFLYYWGNINLTAVALIKKIRKELK